MINKIYNLDVQFCRIDEYSLALKLYEIENNKFFIHDNSQIPYLG